MPNGADPLANGVNERTPTVTSPVGAEEPVCAADRITCPFAFAVAGLVNAGALVKPVELPPFALVN